MPKLYAVWMDEDEAFYGYKDNAKEIITCKECKHYGGRHGESECALITALAEPKWWLGTSPDDYCSSAERATDE